MSGVDPKSEPAAGGESAGRAFLAKNGGPAALMAHSWPRLTGLILQVLDGSFGVEASVTIMSVLVADRMDKAYEW